MIISAFAFTLLLGAFIFAVLPQGTRRQRVASVFVFVLLIGAVYAGSIDLLSLPKPVRLEWRSLAKAEVLGASIREGKAIYVWLRIGDSPEPRSYMLPWNTEVAQQLQDAMQAGQANGTGVEVSRPFDVSNQPGEPKFYPGPQRPPPPKHYSSHGQNDGQSHFARRSP
jgi:hypothetical protein